LLLGQAAEVIGIEVIEVLRARGPHPPKGRRSRPQGPHPPKGKRKGRTRPQTGPHPPKAKRRGKPIPKTGPHPPRPPGPGKARPAKRRYPKGPAKGPPKGGRVKPLTGPHPPRPPGPGTVGAMSGVAVNHARSAEHPQRLQAVHATAEEFLAPSELQRLMRYTLAHERDFEISEVVSPGVAGRGTIDHEYRRSRVLMDLAEHEAQFLDRIRVMLPLVFRKLKMDPFMPERAELQISNDGDFFRDHSDNSHPEIASRALTFVYFFNAEPTPFRGGELRLYDTRRQGDDWVRQGEGRVIVPEQNQMVFFPSGLVHEITPVVCPSRDFTDSRFTVNGWLHRS
jgi:2OG-Fe(II) oxygenase superfamily